MPRMSEHSPGMRNKCVITTLGFIMIWGSCQQVCPMDFMENKHIFIYILVHSLCAL